MATTKRFLFFIFFLSIGTFVLAQKKTATVEGKVIDEYDQPLKNVSIQVLNRNTGTTTNDSGYFIIHLIADKPVALVFSYTGLLSVQKQFLLNSNEKEKITVKLKYKAEELQKVEVTDKRNQNQSGAITIDAQKANFNPSPIGGIEGLIKTIVGSNNELTSQYAVRGGNYDENLVYVNDYEIYRPFLVSNGQQEGLSFINQDLTSNVKFYTGGFQARYGDKMSSALDVTYKKPTQNAGSVYIGLMEQGLHVEGISKNKKFTYLVGVRNRDNRNILSSQQTSGTYIPSSSDVQGLFGWQLSNKWQLELYGNYSQTRFTFYPQQEQLTANVFSPLYSASYGADINFEGREKDKYTINFTGLTATQQVSKRVKLKWMFSHYGDNEQQNQDILAAYLFGERSFDPNSGSAGTIVNPLAQGINQSYARDQLKINLWTIQHKGYYDVGKNYIQWGLGAEKQYISNNINEWTYNDSAGYSLPVNTSQLLLQDVRKGIADINLTRLTGYIQDNIQFGDSSGAAMQIGARYNYNTLNKEFLISPRVNFSYRPRNWEKDVVFRASAGIYDQPPFFREMVTPDGTLNTNIKAQKSWQITGGFDYNFKMFDRKAKFTTEAYYKNMTDIIPYDINNVRIQYYGQNNAKAYAMGLEARLFGELVKDAESWISLGIMRTREKLDNDYYTTYSNAAGQTITSTTQDKVPVDSATHQVGWLRRPTDRLVTLGMFFQDYLSTNKNFKVFLNSIYGSNLPFNIPGSTRYRNGLTIPGYFRVDIGFSALLLDATKPHRSHSPFRAFKNIWATMEVFNLLDKSNTISYMLIKDYSNTTYALPNYLTPRLLNFKIIANW